eukprot:gene17541-23862_t
MADTEMIEIEIDPREGDEQAIIADAIAREAAAQAKLLAEARALLQTHADTLKRSPLTRPKTMTMKTFTTYHEALELVNKADAKIAADAAASSAGRLLTDLEKNERSLALATRKGWTQADGSPWDLASIGTARQRNMCYKCGSLRLLTPGSPPKCPTCPMDRRRV